MTLVALVTPADENSPSYQAFQDELARLNPANPPPTAYKASDPAYGSIEAAARAAVTAVTNQGGVLVAAGEMAAYYVQDATSKTNPANRIPIILAFGGDKPTNAGSYNWKQKHDRLHREL